MFSGKSVGIAVAGTAVGFPLWGVGLAVLGVLATGAAAGAAVGYLAGGSACAAITGAAGGAALAS